MRIILELFDEPILVELLRSFGRKNISFMTAKCINRKQIAVMVHPHDEVHAMILYSRLLDNSIAFC
jgi:hypothetical protein